MSERYPGWVNGMDAQDARLATGALAFPAAGAGASAVAARTGVRPGPGEPGQVSAGSGLAVEVAPFQAVIQDGQSATGGAYLVTLDSPKALALDGADQANARIDLVVAELVEPTDDNPQGFRVWAITGEPAADPQPPALPATATVLAEVRVAAGATQISPGDLTDLRGWTCAVGGVLRIPNAGARPDNPYPGLYVHNIADRVLECFDGSGWQRYLPEEDTGWHPITINTPDYSHITDWDPTIWIPPQVRRVGKIVFARGFLQKNREDAGGHWATLPPGGFAPAARHRWIASGAHNLAPDVGVQQDGEMHTVNYRALGVGTEDGWFAAGTSWVLG